MVSLLEMAASEASKRWSQSHAIPVGLLSAIGQCSDKRVSFYQQCDNLDAIPNTMMTRDPLGYCRRSKCCSSLQRPYATGTQPREPILSHYPRGQVDIWMRFLFQISECCPSTHSNLCNSSGHQNNVASYPRHLVGYIKKGETSYSVRIRLLHVCACVHWGFMGPGYHARPKLSSPTVSEGEGRIELTDIEILTKCSGVRWRS